MKKDKHKTKIIFRYWRISKDVIAIFPEVPGDMNPYTCQSYERTGQHSACTPDGIIQESRLATPKEYNDLKVELESNFGYNLTIIKKHLSSHTETRRKGLSRIK